MDTIHLTPEEKAAIRALKRLAKRWPRSLWVFAGAGSFEVMRKGEDGGRVHVERCRGDGYDQDYVVETIRGIECDGGDW